MKAKFKCPKCHSVFSSTGNKIEWNDPIYGPCFKYTAKCPKCEEESTEFRPPKMQKTNEVNHNSGCGCCSKANSCGMAEN